MSYTPYGLLPAAKLPTRIRPLDLGHGLVGGPRGIAALLPMRRRRAFGGLDELAVLAVRDLVRVEPKCRHVDFVGWMLIEVARFEHDESFGGRGIALVAAHRELAGRNQHHF